MYNVIVVFGGRNVSQVFVQVFLVEIVIPIFVQRLPFKIRKIVVRADE